MFLLSDPAEYASLVSVSLGGNSETYARAAGPEEVNQFIAWLEERKRYCIPLNTIRLTGRMEKIGSEGSEGDSSIVERPRDWMVWEAVGEFVHVVDERWLTKPGQRESLEDIFKRLIQEADR